MVKKTILAGVIIVVVICIVTIFFFVLARQSKDTTGSTQNYLVRMEYFTGMEVLEEDRYWVDFRVQKSGDCQFVKFIRHNVLMARNGKLSRKELDSLMSFIETTDFYDMKKRYEHEKELVCEGGFTTINVNFKDEYKSIYAHCTLAPDNFYRIRDKLMETGESLANELSGTFIRAEKLDARRVRGIKEKFEFISLSGKIDKYPLLDEAVKEPGFFVHAASSTEIDDFILEGYNYFFIQVDKKYYQINVFHT
jgi:hypothetical protein